jgi:phenylpyruvate tautomerase PptA (4-oxalocrotonate tautomerase family)
MPFYHCLAPSGLIDAEMRQKIVDEITRIHCDATGGLPLFVQVQFEDVAPGMAFQNGKPSSAVRLHARIRAGRSAETRLAMLTAYTEMLHQLTKVPVAEIMVAFVETSYENAMEAGVRLPAPGDEAAWEAQFRNASGNPTRTR